MDTTVIKLFSSVRNTCDMDHCIQLQTDVSVDRIIDVVIWYYIYYIAIFHIIPHMNTYERFSNIWNKQLFC